MTERRLVPYLQVRMEAAELFQELAASGHRVPIGTHLVLHRRADHRRLLLDGAGLGEVIAEAAACFATPLAVPLMDLTLEKEALLSALGVAAEEIDSFHFPEPPPEEVPWVPTPRIRATCEAVARVAAKGDLLPMGMGIGPFSLMTKLVADPITPVFLAGNGCGPDEEPEIAVIEGALEAGTRLILAYMKAQIEAGAKAFILCEPAANSVYFSPLQLEQSHAVFERYVMGPLGRIKRLLDEHGVALVFHDCGELTAGMLERFAGLAPAMVSLGSSRMLWEDAGWFPRSTVLYGNLPTKRFVAPQLTVAEVGRLADELLDKMRATGHPFILGSECDVLSVPGQEDAILHKVEAFLGRSVG